jgi:hypothetical protein
MASSNRTSESKANGNLWIWVLVLCLGGMLLLSISCMDYPSWLPPWANTALWIIGAATLALAPLGSIIFAASRLWASLNPWDMTVRIVERDGIPQAGAPRDRLVVSPSTYTVELAVVVKKKVEISKLWVSTPYRRPGYRCQMLHRALRGTAVYSLFNARHALPNLILPPIEEPQRESLIYTSALEDISPGHQRYKITPEQSGLSRCYLYYEPKYEVSVGETITYRVRTKVAYDSAGKGWKGKVIFASSVDGHERPVRRSLEVGKKTII